MPRFHYYRQSPVLQQSTTEYTVVRPPRQSRLFPIGLAALFLLLLLTAACSTTPGIPSTAPGVPSANPEVTPPDFVPLVQVAVGKYHTCGLQADGKAVCWGDDNVYNLKDAPAGEKIHADNRGAILCLRSES